MSGRWAGGACWGRAPAGFAPWKACCCCAKAEERPCAWSWMAMGAAQVLQNPEPGHQRAPRSTQSSKRCGGGRVGGPERPPATTCAGWRRPRCRFLPRGFSSPSDNTYFCGYLGWTSRSPSESRAGAPRMDERTRTSCDAARPPKGCPVWPAVNVVKGETPPAEGKKEPAPPGWACEGGTAGAIPPAPDRPATGRAVKGLEKGLAGPMGRGGRRALEG